MRCEWRARLAEREPTRLHYSYDAGTWLLWLGDTPMAVRDCPGCGGALPQIGPVVGKLRAEGWVDTYTGEEGG